MLVTHQRLVPRWKEWVPLATHQLRLRNLIQVLAFSIKNDKNRPLEEKSNNKESFYYTLHLTTMSSPFYTSEKLETDSPKWKEIEITSWAGEVCSSADALVIRLWSHVPDEEEDQVITVWGVYLSGLTYLGQNLGTDTPLKPNSIVFLMPGGYFTDPACLESEPKIRFTSISINNSDIRPSYTVNTLGRLNSLQQAIRKEAASADILKQKILTGDFFRNENRGRTMLRRILSKHKPKGNHQEILKVKENIELAKYRVQVLNEEKKVTLTRLSDLNKKIELKSDSNQMLESKIMESYRLLLREVQSHREWKKGHIERREGQLHSRAILNFRTKQLISELDLIYPIIEVSQDKYTICGVHLPDSEDFQGHDEIQISVALGFVTHVIQMISIFLQVPLRYPVIHYGSRSRIVDQIADKIPDTEREFPLYLRGKDKLQFHYAVYLLNKNIAQLRWLCGLPTQDLRSTLANLSSLVKMKSNNSNLEPSNRSLSSSTADIYSSSLSISSPIGSILSLTAKKNSRTYRLSESDCKTQKISPLATPHVPGHRVSKSVGSAKDLMINVFPINDDKKPENVMNNSFSYSLDKGLNEYEEIAEQEKIINHVGSKPSLNSQNPTIEIKTPELEAKNTFLKSWESEKQNVILSDEDSDLSLRKLNILENDTPEIAKYCEVHHQKNHLSLLEDNKEGYLLRTEEEIPQDDVIGKEESTEVVESCVKVDNDDTKNGDVGNILCTSDSLLENVKSRTEALANQTTSFNRCRTRFRSMLESSN